MRCGARSPGKAARALAQRSLQEPGWEQQGRLWPVTAGWGGTPASAGNPWQTVSGLATSVLGRDLVPGPQSGEGKEHFRINGAGSSTSLPVTHTDSQYIKGNMRTCAISWGQETPASDHRGGRLPGSGGVPTSRPAAPTPWLMCCLTSGWGLGRRHCSLWGQQGG